jgi:hypothetical protein
MAVEPAGAESGDMRPDEGVRTREKGAGMTEKVPARLNVVTFGIRDLPAVRNFYEALGWQSHSAGDEWTERGGTRT